MIVYTLGKKIKVSEEGSSSTVSFNAPPFRSSITAQEMLKALADKDNYDVFLDREVAINLAGQQARFEAWSDFGDIVDEVSAIYALHISPTALLEKDPTKKTYTIAKKDINEVVSALLYAQDVTDPLMRGLREGPLTLEVNLQDSVVKKYKDIFDNPKREEESSISSSINDSIDVSIGIANIVISGTDRVIPTPAAQKEANRILMEQQKATKFLIERNKQFVDNATALYQSGWWRYSRDKNNEATHLINSKATLFGIVKLLETQKSAPGYQDKEYDGLIAAVKSKLSEDKNLAVAISEETDMVSDVADIVVSYFTP